MYNSGRREMISVRKDCGETVLKKQATVKDSEKPVSRLSDDLQEDHANSSESKDY